VQKILIDATDVNQMLKVFLVVIFQPFSSAAVAYQLSITHIHSSHHQIIVDYYFGLLDFLASNPSLDKFFVTSVTHRTNIFLAFPFHYHKFVLVECHIFSLFFLSILLSLFCQAPLPILMQYSHGVSLFAV
jgi:hypothetical protein